MAARLSNHHIGLHPNEPLTLIRNQMNEEVPDFPATDGDIERMTGGFSHATSPFIVFTDQPSDLAPPLNALLAAYGLSTLGNVNEKRSRLRIHLGIVVRSGAERDSWARGIIPK